MYVPSSTSSSDLRDDPPNALRIVLWCLFFLVLMRLGLSIHQPAWRDRPDILNTTEYLRQSDQNDVRVLAIGSSRMQSAFSSEVWAKRAGLDPKQVINLSVNNGQFWDSRYMLNRVGGPRPSVELVLIEAARWNFNRNKVTPGFGRIRYDYPEHLRQQGGLLDRWSVDDRVDRVRLLIEFVWPLYQRRNVEQWIEYFDTKPPVIPHVMRSVHWNEAQHARLRAIRFLQADSIVLDHFDDPGISSFARRNFELLIREARAHGAKVVLLTLPTRDLYQNKILSDPSRRRFVDLIDALLDSQLGDGVYAVTCKRSRDCDLTEDIFVDYGHLTAKGANALTDRLFDRIQPTDEAH